VHRYTARRRDAVRRPKIAPLSEHERGRQEAVGEQLLRSVQIGEDGVEETCALRDGGRDRPPLLRWKNQRKDVELPRTGRAFGIGVYVVADAVRGDGVVNELRSQRERNGRHRSDVREKRLPMPTRTAMAVDHLVVTRRRGRVARQ